MYVIAMTFFHPGARVIISPITCKTVIYALLSASVLPVFVDIDLSSGNIDVTKIPRDVLKSATGIITTNLYGTPDNALKIKELADSYELVMVEDCAHVIDSSVQGNKIGTIGDVALFSFKKFFHLKGGVICARDVRLRDRMEAFIWKECLFPQLHQELKRVADFFRKRNDVCKLYQFVQRMKTFLRGKEVERKPAASELSRKYTIPQLAYHSFLALTDPDYHVFPTVAELFRVLLKLEDILQIINRINQRNATLLAKCHLPVVKSRYESTACYMVVPYFCEQKNKIIQKMLVDKKIPTWYTYDPPLNEVFANTLNLPRLNAHLPAAREWCDKILPINPFYMREYLATINDVLESVH